MRAEARGFASFIYLTFLSDKRSYLSKTLPSAVAARSDPPCCDHIFSMTLRGAA
jgi:hypothetical protein